MAESDLDLLRGRLYCALFLLQGASLKEGWLRWDSHEPRVIRELFLALCREEPPVGYVDDGYRREWERRHRSELWRHLEFVRRRHEQTKYRDRSDAAPEEDS